jgi:hypothetical protein
MTPKYSFFLPKFSIVFFILKKKRTEVKKKIEELNQRIPKHASPKNIIKKKSLIFTRREFHNNRIPRNRCNLANQSSFMLPSHRVWTKWICQSFCRNSWIHQFGEVVCPLILHLFVTLFIRTFESLSTIKWHVSHPSTPYLIPGTCPTIFNGF